MAGLSSTALLPPSVSSPPLHPQVALTDNMKKSQFVKSSILTDSLAVRCADFTSSGELYAVGSNSRAIYICQNNSQNSKPIPTEANIIATYNKYHKGSIYCLSWSADGSVLATGSNDKTVKLTRVGGDQTESLETTLTMHEATVRDCCWLAEGQTLISAGAGEEQIFLTDCYTGEVEQTRGGHSGHAMCLYSWAASQVFVSGGQDGQVVFWDSRTSQSVARVKTGEEGSEASCVNSVCVDPTGRLLVTGHADGTCGMHDIRGRRHLNTVRQHSGEVRSVRLSPPATHLLSVGYDGNLVLTDLQGDITMERQSVKVGRHEDKVVSVRWHPGDCSFITCSADKTAVVWSLSD